jgi:hypothetical protein
MKPCTAIDGLQEQEEPINTMEGRMSLSKNSLTNPDYFAQKDTISFRVQLIYI